MEEDLATSRAERLERERELLNQRKEEQEEALNREMERLTARELEAMEDLDDQILWKEAKHSPAPAKQRRLAFLLEKKKRRELSDIEQKELALLHAQADRQMLRRSYAYLLLKYRGHRIPTLAEMKP